MKGLFFGGGLFFIFVMALNLAIGCAVIWVAGSVITSGFKVATHNCGNYFPVEEVLGGNWFCPDDKAKK